MRNHVDRRRLLVIDQDDRWRARLADALRALGFEVDTLGKLEYPRWKTKKPTTYYDLVILGCQNVTDYEWELIHELVEERRHLLVLPAIASSALMRKLFLAGVDDVADKSYDMSRITGYVLQTLDDITPRDSYELVRQRGAS